MDDDIQELVEATQLQDAEEKKRGKPVNEVWELFTNAVNAHQVASVNNSVCKHCKKSGRHHNKPLSTQTHLNKMRSVIDIDEK
ncbi:hypothetical protein PsorP6_013822 [Peronosclerospora sorghi]|uniref:Uncharacterized protein n=1 Tax=Peronosclerospora sorghi TaxID=230839 RepID=A0ACC0VI26_9STRA|nr:hypothetical protein PsorP6_013822 [Peronosclerospora sorghi]